MALWSLPSLLLLPQTQHPTATANLIRLMIPSTLNSASPLRSQVFVSKRVAAEARVPILGAKVLVVPAVFGADLARHARVEPLLIVQFVQVH